jgi:hypothetical protein
MPVTRASLVVVAMSLIGVLVGCNKTFCNGTITCGQFDLTKCASVSGCTPGPACEVRTNQPQSCTTATDQVSCASPMCNWIDNACVPFCRTLTTETTCNGYQWSEKDQYGSSLWGCGWVQCLGTPEIRSCGHYSVAMCPADLGCRVETSNGFPDN